MAQIYPSLIAGDLMNLRKELELLDPHCDGYHLDVMDNHFVPNLTWGPQFINAIANTTHKPLFVHLMVDDPTDWINKLTLTQHSTISIHIESKGNLRVNLKRIQEKHLKASVALNPHTPVQAVFPVLNIIESVLIMSVEPGFSGQEFMPEVIKKLEPLIGYRETSGLHFDLAMDGGISEKNIQKLATQGIQLFGIGSAIFEKPNKIQALKQLYELTKT